jgi:dTDP-4-amino-4,6-dideoxygalactose transaminase
LGQLPARALEQRLCDLFAYRRAVLFGRARSGMVAVLQVLSMAGKPVLFPSNICPAVLAAIAAAGGEPVSVSVSTDSGLVASAAFMREMACATMAGVVMPTHLYGLWRSYDDLPGNGWFVLENDTLCAATARNGRRTAIGDALLVSFNQTKTIEAGGGGAILTDDPAFAAALEDVARSWPPLSTYDQAVEDNVMLARRCLRSLRRGELGERLFDLDVAGASRSFSDEARGQIAEALDRFPQVIARKWKRVEMWDAALAGLCDELLSPEAELAVPWRLTKRLRRPELRDPLVARPRADGFDAETNYPQLAREFPSMLPRQQDAEHWANCVINLWLTDDYDRARIDAVGAAAADVFAAAA